MHLVIHDASLRKVAFVDNTKQNTLKYLKYEWYRSLETAGSTFNVTIQKKAIQTDNHYEVAYTHLNERSFITFKAKNKTHLFSVMVVTENEETITCECESANLELINEYTNPYKATKAMTFVEYCNAMDLLKFTYLTIGLNEVSDKKLTLEWEDQDTKLARLLSLANKFDAEIEFDTRLNADSSIKQFILNVYHENDDKHQGVGRIREDVQLVYGKNIKSVTRTIDKTKIVNAIRPTGTKDGNTVVISGLSAWEEKNEDGIVEFYQKGEMLYAPISMQLYPSTFTHDTIDDQWTRKDITVDSDNPTVVRAEGIKALKRLAYPSITYEVDGFFDGEIGDTVKVIDNGFVPKLILKARVIEQYIYDDETKNKTVLGNFTALENRVSDDMQARLNELIEQAKPYTIKLATDNGVVFKDQEGETIVTPMLYKGGKPSASSVVWSWTLDGITTTGTTYTVRGADVADTATLTVSAYVGNDEVATDEVSFVNVFDGAMGTPGAPGKDGRTPYVHTAWANNATGTSGFSLAESTNKLYIGIYTDFEPADSTDPTKYNWTLIKGEKGDKGDDGVAGKDGKGITNTVITYGISANETTQPTTWTTAVPTLVKGQYLWTKNVWTYTDNTTETGYVKTYIAKDGNSGTNGIAGKDGVGIKSTSITYASSPSGTTAPTSGWSTSVPTVSPGLFLWTKTVWTYSDNTNETGYSVARMGTDGAQGTPGPKGVDGKTSYHHWAYSENADGTGLTTSDNGQRYMGYYTDYTQADSTDKTKYTWADRWAKIEVGGKNILRNSAFANATDLPERFTVGGVTYPNKAIPYWNNLYNGGISNPTTSYHAIYRESFNGKRPVIEFNESDGSRNWKAITPVLQADDLSFGNYTFSADIYATGTGTKIFFGFYYFNKNGVRYFHSGLTTVNITKINEWHRASGAIKLNNDADLTKPVYFYIYAYDFATNSILYLTKPQLEEGTVPTPYGVSQQDIQADIDSKADQDKVVYKTDISVTDEGIVHSASKTVNGQTIASMIAQRAEWVEIIANLLKVKGDMIVDGTIGANKLSVSTLAALVADLGQISGGSLELLESVAQGTSVDSWGSFTIPAHKWGLYIDSVGAISSGTPVRKSSSESVASDMPVAVLRSGGIRFAMVDQSNDLKSVLHYGTSDADNAAISFGVAPDGTKQLLILANGQIINQGTNYTGWISTGVSGVYYKRQGDVVALKMQVTTTANESLNLGSIPVALVPIPNNGTMMRVASWTANQTFGRNLQISGDGSMFLLASNRGDTFNTQVTWII